MNKKSFDEEIQNIIYAETPEIRERRINKLYRDIFSTKVERTSCAKFEKKKLHLDDGKCSKCGDYKHNHK